MKYDLTGRKFGSLTVLSRGFHVKSQTEEWLCKCDCGVSKVIPSGSLRNGKTKTCGCGKTKGRLKDITGEIYGRLTIIGFSGMAPNRVSIWTAKCTCGKEIEVRKNNLCISKDGKKNTVSCGCHRVHTQIKRHTTHGESSDKNRLRTKEYVCWQNMWARCTNPKNPRYKSYGLKGVKICDRWKEYEKFLIDVGRAPIDKPYIDREDPYGNYEPDNVRWVDFDTSNENKRKN